MNSRIRWPAGMVFLLVLALLPVMKVTASRLEAHLIIVGPGDPVYTYWGHIGIAVADLETGESSFYDFGNFSFHSDNFYTDFAMGRMLYLGMETPTEYFIGYSLTEDRDLLAYPLNLGDKELEILRDRLEWWVRPENREYLYDYYHANCSTIIRDVLDEAVGGALKEASTAGTDVSFRHLSRTGAASSAASEILLHFLLGPAQDDRISEWELMFLPQAVADSAMELEYTGMDGTDRFLAGPPLVLKESTRPPVPEEPRTLWPFMLMAGVALAALWTAAAALPQEKRGRRIIAISLRILITIIIGVPGLILGFIMVFTDHNAAYSNLNIGPAFPLVLAGIVPLLRMRGRTGQDRHRFEKRLALYWTVNLAGLLLVIILRTVGLSAQDAFAFWAFYMPILAAASLPGYLLRNRYFPAV